MPRSKKSKSKHDREVRRIANDLKNKGFDVQADVTGYPQPSTIGGFRPDVIAKSGRERVIVEVETPDSVGGARDAKQQQAFRNAAKQAKNTTFRRKVTD